MGRQATKRVYFVSVGLGEYVPEDDLLRAVDHYLDLSDFRQHIPVWDKSGHNDGTFERAAFVYDAQNNRYVCPRGNI